MTTTGATGRPATEQQLRNSIWCPHCDQRWSGLSRQHCTAESWSFFPLTVWNGDSVLTADVDAKLDQCPVDSGRVATKLMSDLVGTETGGVKESRLLLPVGGKVKEFVFAGGYREKILGSVVGAIPIDVVNVVFRDDPSLDDSVLVGLDVVVRTEPPTEPDVPMGADVPMRLMIGNRLTREEVSDGSLVSGLATRGTESLLRSPGDGAPTHGTGHVAILQVGTMCHRTFSGTTSGDAHRKGRGGERHCVDPAEAKMVATRHWWGECWGYPGLAGGQPFWQEPTGNAAANPEDDDDE